MFIEKGRGSGDAVLEMCYHPQPQTMLYRDFASAGWHAILGIEAMVYQAFAQQVLWPGYDLHELPTEAANLFLAH